MGKQGQLCTAVGETPVNVLFSVFVAYTSNDGGVSWEEHKMTQKMEDLHINGIACKGENGENCIAVGYAKINNAYKALSYVSANGGKNWNLNISTLENGSKFKAIICNSKDTSHCIALGSKLIGSSRDLGNERGGIFVNKDGGVSWTAAINNNGDWWGTLSEITCSGANGQYCLATGYDIYHGIRSLLYRSVDGGDSWNLKIGFTKNLYSTDTHVVSSGIGA